MFVVQQEETNTKHGTGSGMAVEEGRMATSSSMDRWMAGRQAPKTIDCTLWVDGGCYESCYKSKSSSRAPPMCLFCLYYIGHSGDATQEVHKDNIT